MREQCRDEFELGDRTGAVWFVDVVKLERLSLRCLGGVDHWAEIGEVSVASNSFHASSMAT
jgi:hypothetical protein